MDRLFDSVPTEVEDPERWEFCDGTGEEILFIPGRDWIKPFTADGNPFKLVDAGELNANQVAMIRKTVGHASACGQLANPAADHVIARIRKSRNFVTVPSADRHLVIQLLFCEVCDDCLGIKSKFYYTAKMDHGNITCEAHVNGGECKRPSELGDKIMGLDGPYAGVRHKLDSRENSMLYQYIIPESRYIVQGAKSYMINGTRFIHAGYDNMNNKQRSMIAKIIEHVSEHHHYTPSNAWVIVPILRWNMMWDHKPPKKMLNIYVMLYPCRTDGRIDREGRLHRVRFYMSSMSGPDERVQCERCCRQI